MVSHDLTAEVLRREHSSALEERGKGVKIATHDGVQLICHRRLVRPARPGIAVRPVVAVRVRLLRRVGEGAVPCAGGDAIRVRVAEGEGSALIHDKLARGIDAADVHIRGRGCEGAGIKD